MVGRIVIPALLRLRQEEGKFNSSLGCMETWSLKTNKQTNKKPLMILNVSFTGHWWFPPAILVTQEAEIRRIMVGSQHRQIIPKTLSGKTLYKNKTGGVPQGPEFNPQYGKSK
jgi:hypothetical protein